MASLIGKCSSWNVIFLTLLLLTPFPSHSADPDPLQDFCVADLAGNVVLNGFPCKPASNVTSEDFFFDGLIEEGDTNNTFGSRPALGNVLAFPGLNTMGMSMNRVDFAPGGLNPPHSHPRATESGVVIKGKLLVGFITTGNDFYSKILGPGQMFVIPRGLVHFQINVGKEKALIITAFNSQLPGVAIVPLNLFASTPAVPDYVLSKAFQVGSEVIDEIKSKFAA